jgi:hypothetical protein
VRDIISIAAYLRSAFELLGMQLINVLVTPGSECVRGCNINHERSRPLFRQIERWSNATTNPASAIAPQLGSGIAA